METVMAVVYPPEDMLMIVRAWLALIALVAFLLVESGRRALLAYVATREPLQIDSAVINLRMVTRHRAHPYMTRSERLTGLVTR